MHSIRVLMASVTMHCVYVSVCVMVVWRSYDNGHCKVVILQTLSLFHYISISQQLNISWAIKMRAVLTHSTRK